MRKTIDPLRNELSLAGFVRSRCIILLVLVFSILPCAASAAGDRQTEDDEHAYLYRYRVSSANLYSSSGPLPYTDASNHGSDHARLSVEDQARLQAETLAYWKSFKKSGAPVTREVMIELYRTAQDFSIVHALLGAKVISYEDSVELGKQRASLHLGIVDNLVRSGRLGNRLGINDFGSVGTAKSDIDFTLFTEKGIPGSQLVAAYLAEFRRFTGGVDPGQMDIVAHRWEATIPDWRQSQLSLADYAGDLRSGTELLKQNPEAYFLEGAYNQQIMGRSAVGKTFTWFDKAKGDTVQRNSVNAAESTAFFYRPEFLARYAWGGSVGNWHFYHAHPHDKVAQAKYLLRSFDDGAGLTLPPSLKDGKFENLTPQKQRSTVAALYRNRTSVGIDTIVAMLRTAVSIRAQKDVGAATDGPKAFQPMIEHERTLDRGADEATLLKRARRSVDRHGQAMLIENNRISAGTRLQDWLSPPIRPGSYPTLDAEGEVRTIDIDADAVTRLQYNAFFELKDGIEVLPEAEVEAIKRQNPRARGDIEILQRLIRKQRQMALAPDDLYGSDATKYRHSAARDVLTDLARLDQVAAEGGPAKFAGEATRRGWHNAQRFETWVQRTMVNALRPAFGTANSKYLPSLDGLLGMKQDVDDRVNEKLGPNWMARLDKASSVLEVLKERARQGEWNWDVAKVALREIFSFFPGVGTLYQFQSGAQGIVTLVSTQIIPGYGQMVLVMNLVRGSVELVGLAVISPLQRDRIDLAYYGYLEAGDGGLIESGQTTRIESRLPSILLPIDSDTTKPMIERRESVYTYFHDNITETIDADPAFNYTELEWPDEWAAQESRWLEVRIRQHVNHWWNATGPFDSYDELVIHRTATMKESEFRAELEQRLWRDYYEGKKIALQGRIEEQNTLTNSVMQLFEQIAAVANGLTQRAYEMKDEFLQAGQMIWAYALDEMPIIKPAIEISLAPRVIQLELDDTYVQDEVLAIPSFGASAKVYASEAEYPLPWTVVWELKAGGESHSLGAGESVEIEAQMSSSQGTDPVYLTAIARDAGGNEIIRHRVELAIEKIALERVREDGRKDKDSPGGDKDSDLPDSDSLPDETMDEEAGQSGGKEATGDICATQVSAQTAIRDALNELDTEVLGAQMDAYDDEDTLERIRQAIPRVDALTASISRLTERITLGRDRSASLRDQICSVANRFSSLEPGARKNDVRLKVRADLEKIRTLRERARSWQTLLDGVLAESEELTDILRTGAPEAGPNSGQGLAELEGRLANTRAAVEALDDAPSVGCELQEDRTSLTTDLDAITARLEKLRDSIRLRVAENAALRSRATTAATTLDDAMITAELLRVFIDSILNRAAEAERCAGLLDSNTTIPEPEPTPAEPPSANDGWSTGERTDETGGGWSTGERSDEVDPCRGPRPEYSTALQNIKRALQAQDLAALAPVVGRLRPECPGDVDLLTALRDQAVALARAEARANQTSMQSAVSNAKTRAQRNKQSWASALGTIQKAINEIERARTGTRSGPTSGTTSTGMGAGTTSTTSGSSSDEAVQNRCVIDYPRYLSPEGQGRSYSYYVQKQAGWSAGVTGFTVLQFSSSVSQAPSIPGSTLDGPFNTYDAALAHMERLCPPSQRSTGSVRYQ